MGWLKNILGVGGGDSVLSAPNQELLGDYRQSSQKCVSMLRGCRTRQQVIDALSRIGRAGYDVSPVAARAANELAGGPELDALRVRDDFVRTLESFLSSTHGV